MTATSVNLSTPYGTPTSVSRLGGIYTGNGDPTSALVVPKGSLYVKLDAASTTTRLWIATDAAGTWTYFTSNA